MRGYAAILLGLMIVGPVEARERLDLRYQGLDLPGVPVAVHAVDLDGDGRRDLALVVAYTQWMQEAFEEKSEMEGIEGLVEILTIVPSLEDRRELWTFLAAEDGTYVSAGPPLPLGPEVVAIDRGPGSVPLVALTDSGLVAVERREDGLVELRPLLERRPVMAGSGVFLPGLSLTADLLGDGEPDLVLPVDEGLVIRVGTSSGFSEEEMLVPHPGEPTSGRERDLLLPEARDVTGDGLPDLVWRDSEEGWQRSWVADNRNRTDLSPPRELDFREAVVGEVVWFGDIDGDGSAELVSREDREPEGDLGMREEMRLAESPPYRYHLYRVAADGSVDQAYRQFDTRGHSFGGDGEMHLPGGLQDLEGAGRLALVSIDLELSIRKALGALVTHRITLPMDFRIDCQDEAGVFRPVVGLDLSGKFRLNLERVEIRGLPMFEGDFDGDGRTDFVQFGRGRKVTFHLGGEDCTFPASPDLRLELEQEAALMELIRIEDLDADGRSDLMIIQPGRRSDGVETPSVRLDLYVSGGTP